MARMPQPGRWRGCARALSTIHDPYKVSDGCVYCRRCGDEYEPAPRRVPTPVVSPTNPRSEEAYGAREPVKVADREAAILGYLRAGPMTTYEIERRTGWKHQTASAIMSRLYHARRMIRPSGVTRLTDTGRRADVYEIGDPQAADAPVQPRAGSRDSR